MIRIDRARLRNCRSIREADISIPRSGIVQVIGENSLGGSKLRSVGSGKSSFLEAIHRAVFGWGGENSLKRFSTGGKGDTYARIDGQLGSNPFYVEIGYKCRELSKSGEGIRFKIGDADVVEREHVRATRKELVAALGLTPELAEWTVCLDGDRLKFDELGQAATVEILMSALQQPPWSDYHEMAVRAVRILSEDSASAEGQLNQAKATLAKATSAVSQASVALQEATERFSAESRQHAEKEARLVSDRDRASYEVDLIQDSRKGVAIQIKLREKEASEATAALEIERLELKSKLTVAESELRSAVSDLSAETAKLAVAQAELRKIRSRPKTCPTCGQERRHDDPTELLEAENSERVAAQGKDKAQSVVTRLRNDVDTVRNLMNEVSTKIAATKQSGIRQLSDQYESLDYQCNAKLRELELINSALAAHRKGPDRTALTKAEAVLAEREKALIEAEEAVEKSAKLLSRAQLVTKVGSYWKEAFSPAGIPNMILRSSIEPLNQWAAHFSSELTGGAVRVYFSAERELQSGKEKSELVANATDRSGSALLRPSKGESGMVNLIIAEALASIGGIRQRVKYRSYDEVINSFDPVARRSFLSLLKEQCTDSVAFVVGHQPEIEVFASHTIIARKTADGTAIIG